MAEADAATTTDAGAGEAEGKGKSKSKLVIIIAGAVVLLGLGGGGAYLLGLVGGGGDAQAAKEAASQQEGHTGTEKGGGEEKSAIASLDNFVVNLADEESPRYLKVLMNVEFLGNEVPPAFATRRPQIRDLVLTLLSSKFVADVRTIEGKQQLRDEVTARINRVLEDDVVKAVYFGEFIVQ